MEMKRLGEDDGTETDDLDYLEEAGRGSSEGMKQKLERMWAQAGTRRIVWIVVAASLGLLVVCGAVMVVLLAVSLAEEESSSGGMATADFERDDPCWEVQQREGVNQPPGDGIRPVVQATAVMIRRGTVFTGKDGAVCSSCDVLLLSGKIAAVGPHLELPAGGVEIDAMGRVVTSGLVDLHSHAGVYSYPADFRATADGNEMTDPTTSYVRALDAFDPEDPALAQIRAGGVTTLQVLPGSGNVMGGEGAIFKLRNSLDISELHLSEAPRTMKMACGENPKNVYEMRGQTPMSRMGSAWLMRKRFSDAQRLIAAQERHCRLPKEARRQLEYPADLALESLTALLRGNVRLNIHCYQVHDLQMALRVTEEFSVPVSAFHHGLEAWKIPQILARRSQNASLNHNLTVAVATFSDLWGYKAEAFDASVHGPARLVQAGVPLILKTDHPVTFAGWLVQEAARAHHYGVPEDRALLAVTAEPARALGLAARVGAIAPGLDADVVVWDRHPLRTGAVPSHVLVDGVLLHSAALPDSLLHTAPPNSPLFQVAETSQDHSFAHYALVHVGELYTLQQGQSEPLTQASLVVENGVVVCISSAENPSPPCSVAGVPSSAVFDFQGRGVVTPGFVESASPIGQLEVGQEPASRDGAADWSPLDPEASLSAVDGLRMRSRHVRATRLGGVLAAIVAPPVSHSVVLGFGAAVVTDDSLADPYAALIAQPEDPLGALHVRLGNSAKVPGSLLGSLSGQVSYLRRLLAADAGVFRNVSAGARVLAVHADAASAIAAVVQLSREFPTARFAIVGGAEAHLLAHELARANIAVVLAPPRCVPSAQFEWSECSADGPSILRAAGVRLALAMADEDNARDLRWEAGAVLAQGRRGALPDLWRPLDALDAISAAVADAYGLGSTGLGRIRVGSMACFAAFDRFPLEYGSYPVLLAQKSFVHVGPAEQF